MWQVSNCRPAFLCGKSPYMADCTSTCFACWTLVRWLKILRITWNFLYSSSIQALKITTDLGGFRQRFPPTVLQNRSLMQGLSRLNSRWWKPVLLYEECFLVFFQLPDVSHFFFPSWLPSIFKVSNGISHLSHITWLSSLHLSVFASFSDPLFHFKDKANRQQ